MEITMQTKNQEFERTNVIRSINDIYEMIIEFCDEYKVKECNFIIKGKADIKSTVSLRDDSLSALFG